jgi:hypothetical protein
VVVAQPPRQLAVQFAMHDARARCVPAVAASVPRKRRPHRTARTFGLATRAGVPPQAASNA